MKTEARLKPINSHRIRKLKWNNSNWLKPENPETQIDQNSKTKTQEKRVEHAFWIVCGNKWGETHDLKCETSDFANPLLTVTCDFLDWFCKSPVNGHIKQSSESVKCVPFPPLYTVNRAYVPLYCCCLLLSLSLSLSQS